MSEPFVIAKTAAGDRIQFLPALANRHGLITGATGTGKTVTLQVLADHFSSIGVPVFLADVKGDLSGIAAAGSLTPKLAERLKAIQATPPDFAREPGGVLGRVRPPRCTGPCDHFRSRPAAARPAASG